jgi:hypothetical protein
MTADAKDKKGRGGAKATITSSLEPAGEGTRVSVDTDVQMRGTIASMGRGVVGRVAAELTDRFAKELAAELRGERDGGPAKAVGGIGLLASAMTRRGGKSNDQERDQ